MRNKKVLIAGDFAPTESNYKLFRDSAIETIFGEKCIQEFSEADLSIVNLEMPLCDTENPIPKWGPNLMAPTYCVHAIKNLGVSLIGLANNHIMDQGVEGLDSTLSLLRDNNIETIGAGRTLEEASKAKYFNLDDKVIGVYACCEHEFTFATENCAGANPFDLLHSFDEIQQIKNKCSYLIVLFHGGIEFYRYPSPKQRQIAHKLADAGADLVVFQHSHCVGCREKYKNSEILYGQGNFIFDGGDNEYWQNGLLIRLNISTSVNIEYLAIQKKGAVVRLDEDTENEVLSAFWKRSNEIRQQGFVEKAYRQFSTIRLTSYLYRMGGKITKSLLFRALNRASGQRLINWVYGEKELLCLIDYLRCEAHNELIDTACSAKTYDKDRV